MNDQISKILSAIFLLLFCVSVEIAHAQSPQQTLTQYISDLQKSPTDTALREKIIRHVQTMSPAPAIPMEVVKFEGAAEYAFKSAKITKSEADFLDAAKEYEKALLIAPWVSAYYFNQGVSFEMAGKLKDAKQSFEFYLLAAPNAQDARDVRKRIGGLEYAMEKAARGSSQAAERQAKIEEKKGLRDLTGNWYRKEPYDHRLYPYDSHQHYRAEMRGESLVFIEVIDVPFFDWRKGDQRDFFIVNRLEGNMLIGRLHHYEGVLEMTVSPDFNDLELIHKGPYGSSRKTYTRR